MATGPNTIFVLDPVAPPPPMPEAKLAARPAALSGLRVSILDNNKPNAGPLMRSIRDELAARYSVTPALHLTKRSPGSGASREQLDQLVAGSDVIIVGVGD